MGTVPKHRRDLGENIRHVREAEGLNQQALARLANLDLAYVRQVEAGRRSISIDALARIAKVLKISVNDLTAGI